MARAVRQTLASRAPALMEYCEQMRYRVLTRARLVAEQTARREAEHVAKIKSNFISMMSHELRTPLNSIIGFSEILAQPSTYLKDSERINYAELINSSGRHLTSVVNSILEMSKIQSGTYTVDLDERNLIEILREIIATTEVLAHKKGVMLARKWQADEIVARVDETRFIQSVSNIVANAIKFTEAGGSITVSCGHDDAGAVVVSVVDTGIGMDEDELAQAMTPFGQAAGGLASGAEGTGLGLCIARELTTLQGGKFSITSQPGQGTTVTFTFSGQAKVDARSLSEGVRDGRGARPARRTLRKVVESHVRN